MHALLTGLSHMTCCITEVLRSLRARWSSNGPLLQAFGRRSVVIRVPVDPQVTGQWPSHDSDHEPWWPKTRVVITKIIGALVDVSFAPGRKTVCVGHKCCPPSGQNGVRTPGPIWELIGHGCAYAKERKDTIVHIVWRAKASGQVAGDLSSRI